MIPESAHASAGSTAKGTGSYDGVLMIAFGGPESMDEVRPFLRRVLEGRPVSEARFEEVVDHYAKVGGRSPLTEVTRAQAAALEAGLAAAGLGMPVVVGMRNSAPFLRDAIAELYGRGCRKILGLIMAAHESPASHGRYRQAVEAALGEIPTRRPQLSFARGFHDHPGYIAANVAHVRDARARLPEDLRARAALVFTAHSIPAAVAAGSPYVPQLEQGAALVADELGVREYKLAFQSRSGSPRDPWLEPDINALIREHAARGTRAMVLCPIGFLCDHVEVLYDLDVEAAATAAAVGVTLARAQTAGLHPAFTGALVDRVREACAATG